VSNAGEVIPLKDGKTGVDAVEVAVAVTLAVVGSEVVGSVAGSGAGGAGGGVDAAKSVKSPGAAPGLYALETAWVSVFECGSRRMEGRGV
jgi:hypothetical protein